MRGGLDVHTPACVDRVRSAGTCGSLSHLGPAGAMSSKGSGRGGWGGTDMCYYLALPHIYHGTATVNDGIREVGRRRSRWTAFLPRARDDTWARGGGGGGERWSWTGAEREICAFPVLHQRLEGREREREKKDRWNISPCGRGNGGKWKGPAQYWEMD